MDRNCRKAIVAQKAAFVVPFPVNGKRAAKNALKASGLSARQIRKLKHEEKHRQKLLGSAQRLAQHVADRGAQPVLIEVPTDGVIVRPPA